MQGCQGHHAAGPTQVDTCPRGHDLLQGRSAADPLCAEAQGVAGDQAAATCDKRAFQQSRGFPRTTRPLYGFKVHIHSLLGLHCNKIWYMVPILSWDYDKIWYMAPTLCFDLCWALAWLEARQCPQVVVSVGTTNLRLLQSIPPKQHHSVAPKQYIKTRSGTVKEDLIGTH